MQSRPLVSSTDRVLALGGTANTGLDGTRYIGGRRVTPNYSSTLEHFKGVNTYCGVVRSMCVHLPLLLDHDE